MDKRIFLTICINDGFTMMLASRLRFSPRKEDQPEAQSMWLLMLINETDWNQKQDHYRLMSAFAYIVKHDHDFPTIARFLELLSPRNLEAPQLLERPEITDESREKGLKMIRDSLSMLRSTQIPSRKNTKQCEASYQAIINQNQQSTRGK